MEVREGIGDQVGLGSQGRTAGKLLAVTPEVSAVRTQASREVLDVRQWARTVL